MKNNKFLEKAINRFYENKNNDKLDKVVASFHPQETYKCIKNWKFQKKINFLKFLNTENLGNVFREFSILNQSKVVEHFDEDKQKEILNELYADEIIDIFEHFSDNLISRFLDFLDEDTKKKIISIFDYDRKKVGYNMTVDFLYIRNSWTLEKARTEIKKQINIEEIEILGNIFVVDNNFIFLGYITLERLFFKKASDKVSTHMQQILPLKSNDNIANIEEIIAKYELSTIPVVDEENKLVGMIEFEEIIKRFEEIEEFFLEASNVKNTDISYFDLKVSQIFKMRIPWVISLLFIGTLTQIIITGFMLIWANNGLYSFQTTAAIPGLISLALTSALSVSSSVNDTAGNSGSQVSATIIRGIAIGEIGEDRYKEAIRKEAKVALMIGIISGIAAFFRLFFVWGIMGFLDSESINQNVVAGHSTLWVWNWYIVIALISSITFFISVMIGAMLGVTLPIFANKRKIDGAIISGPVQTTIIDILTFTIYLSITTAVFIPLYNNGYFGTEEVEMQANNLFLFKENFFNFTLSNK